MTCYQAAFVVSSCWMFEPASLLLIAMRRGFIAYVIRSVQAQIELE
jgi:hypothetical protein